MEEVQVKQQSARSSWIWSALRMPGSVLADAHWRWSERHQCDKYRGTLVNACLAGGGRTRGIRAGTQYVDVGTLQGSRGALAMLAAHSRGHEKVKVLHA